MPAFGAGALKAEGLAGSDEASGLDATGVEDLDRMARDGMGLYRARFRRDVVVDGLASQWTQLDHLVRQASIRGVTVLPILIDMPGDVYTPPKTRAARDAFGDFAAAAVRRYGPAGSFWSTCICPARPIRAWEVWNEPNIIPFWDLPNPAEYAALLKTTRRHLRQADPGARIVFGGLAYPATTSTRKLEPNAFLQDTVAAAGATSFDALSLHTYYRQAYAADAGVDSVLAATVDTLRRVGGAQPSGAPVQQVWLTEFGRYTYPDDPGTVADEAAISEANQAEYYDRFLTRLLAHRADWNLGPLLPYALRDAAQPTANWHRYGLRLTGSDDTDLRAKTAWETFATRSRGSAELPLPGARPDPALSIDGLGAAIATRAPTITGGAGLQADDPTVEVRILAGTTVRDTFELSPDGVTGRYSGTGTTELADGTYTAEVSQADGANEVRTVATQPFEVDLQRPVVSIASPAFETNQADVDLAGTAGDAGSAPDASDDDPSVAVRLFRRTDAGERVQVGETLDAKRTGIAWSVPVAGLVAGTYDVEATQGDAAGNASAPATRSFKVDRSSPRVSLEQPVTPSSDPLPVFRGAAGVTVPATDETADDSTVTVIVRRDSTEIERLTAAVDEAGGWSGRMTRSLPEDGTYTVVVEQRDGAGNVGGAGRSFAYDATGPAVAISAPASMTLDPSPAVEGTAGIAAGDGSTVSIAILAGPTEVEPFIAGRDAVTGRYAATVPAVLADGTYRAEVTQRDAAGNVTVASRSFQIGTAVPADTVAPAVELTGPSGSTSERRPVFRGRAGTGPGDLPTVRLTLHAGDSTAGAVAGSFDVPVAADGTFTGSPSGDLADGTYTAIAAQRDEAQNEGTSRPVGFRVETAAPGPSQSAPSPEPTPSPDPTPAPEPTASPEPTPSAEPTPAPEPAPAGELAPAIGFAPSVPLAPPSRERTLRVLLSAFGLDLGLQVAEGSKARGELRIPAAVARRLGLLTRAQRARRAKFVRLAGASSRLGPDGDPELHFQLSRRVRRTLARSRSLTVSAVITLTDAAGGQRRLVRKLTLKINGKRP